MRCTRPQEGKPFDCELCHSWLGRKEIALVAKERRGEKERSISRYPWNAQLYAAVDHADSEVLLRACVLNKSLCDPIQTPGGVTP